MLSNFPSRVISSILLVVFILTTIFLTGIGLMTGDVYAATSAFSQIEAESYSRLSSSSIQKITINSGAYGLGYISKDDYVAYDSIDFGNSGTVSFKAKVATQYATTIQIRSGSSTGTLLGTLSVSSTGSYDTYQEMTCSVNNITGVNNLYLVFGGAVNIDWFVFTQTSVATPTPTPVATISAFSQIEAENYSSLSTATIQKITINSGAYGLGYISKDNYVVYNNIDFSTGGTVSFKAKVATANATTIQIRSGSPTGTLLGTLSVSSTGSYDTYQEMTCSVSNITGVNNLYLVFGGAVNIDWFVFTKNVTQTPTPVSSLRAFNKIEAEDYSSLSSSTIQQVTMDNGGYALGYISNGDYAVYKGLDFGSIGTSSFNANIATQYPTTLQLRAGSPNGTLLGTLFIFSTGSYDTYREMTFNVGNITGVIDLYMVYGGPVNIDWFKFTEGENVNTRRSAFSKIEAENFSSINGATIQTISNTDGSKGLGYIASGDMAVYNNIDFGDGATLIKAYLATTTATTIDIRTGSVNGPLLGTLSVPSTGSFDTYQEITCKIYTTLDVHDIYLLFNGNINIDWFTFVSDGNPANGPIITPPPPHAVRSAFSEIQGESYDVASSWLTQYFSTGSETVVGYIFNGDNIQYASIDFGSGTSGFKARISAPEATSIEIRAGSLTGNLIGTVAIPSTGSYDTYQEISCSITSNITGVNDLYFLFNGSINIDWFMFIPRQTGKKIDAFSRIEAENNSNVSNTNIQTIDLSASEKAIAYIQSGNYINFNNVDFGTGAVSFKANATCASGSTTDIELRLGSTTGTYIGTLTVPSTESWDVYHELSCNLTQTITGTANLYLVFTGPVNLDWFVFSKTPVAAVTSTPTPTATPMGTATAAPTMTPPAGNKIEQPNVNLSRFGPSSGEIASVKTISSLQGGELTLDGLGTLVGEKEIVLLVDNAISTNYVSTDIVTPLDYGIFANRNIRGVGNQAIIKGDIHANEKLESYISNLNVSGTCSASTLSIGYGSKIEGGLKTITSPIEIPKFSDKIEAEITDPKYIFEPSKFTVGVDQEFPDQPGFHIRYESNNTFVVTGEGIFNLESSMYFKGNLRISVPYIVNTNSNFLLADGFVNLEGNSLNMTELNENEINNNTNLLNIYSKHGRIFIATSNSKIYGTLYAAGEEDPTNTYTKDVGVVLLQGNNNDIYGSIVAGSDIRIEGSYSKFHCTPGINSKVETKYLRVDTSNSSTDTAKKIVDYFKGSKYIKMCALQYSDSANINSFSWFDLSDESKVQELKDQVIDKFPQTDTGFSNMGDALRRAQEALNDPKNTSADATKYIIVLAANAPNKWTRNDDTNTDFKTTTGAANYIDGDGTIDSDGKAKEYAITIGKLLKSNGIRTIFIDNSPYGISDNIEQIAAASGAMESSDGTHHFSANAMPDFSTIYKTVLFDAPRIVVLNNARYEETFPEGIQIVEGPPGADITPVLIGGVTRYKVKHDNLNIKLTYDGTKYTVEEFAMDVKVRLKKLGDITFHGNESKITYNIEYIDADGNGQTAYFEKNFNDFKLNVFMTIDIS